MTTEQVHRRSDYDAMLTIIKHNVGSPQPPLMSANALWTTAVSHGRLDHDNARSALHSAVDNGDALRWTDGDGTVRHGLTTDGLERARGTNPYSGEDKDALRQYIATEAARSNPDQEFIGWANERVGEL